MAHRRAGHVTAPPSGEIDARGRDQAAAGEETTTMTDEYVAHSDCHETPEIPRRVADRDGSLVRRAIELFQAAAGAELPIGFDPLDHVIILRHAHALLALSRSMLHPALAAIVEDAGPPRDGLSQAIALVDGVAVVIPFVARFVEASS
jgi:hypothetical protein